jgi:hypothetical protein
MLFEMPIGDDLRVEKIEGKWFIFYGDEKSPLVFTEETWAIGAAIIAQWASKKTKEKLGEK